MSKKLKRKSIMIIYALIIFILLIVILFVLPDSFFVDKNNDSIPQIDNESPKEFTDYETQIEHLLNKKFEYEYILLDSMGTQSYSFECSGKIDDTIESGTCVLPTKVSYTEKNVAEVYKNIDSRYLDVEFLFNTIKDVEPTETRYQTIREYNYKIKITDLDTDITVHTDLDEITKIYISNAYMTYIMKYTNVSYWHLKYKLLS